MVNTGPGAAMHEPFLAGKPIMACLQ